MVDTAAQAAGVEIPEQLPEPDVSETESKSKSARVREYLDEHPEARNKDVAQALEQYGVKPADVANVKAILKRKSESAKPSKPSATASVNQKESAAASLIDATIQLDLLEAGVEFIRKCGGINEAQHVLGVIRRIRSL